MKKRSDIKRKALLLDKVVLGLNVVATILLLINYLIPTRDFKNFWDLEFININWPAALFIHLIFIIYWFIRLKKNFLISGITLLIGVVIVVINYGLKQPLNYYKVYTVSKVKENVNRINSLFVKKVDLKMKVNLSIDNAVIINHDYLGVNAVYHGFAYMPYNTGAKAMSKNDVARELSRVKTMNLKIARTWYRPDYACGTNISNPYNWESEKMRAFYLWLDQMKKLNVNIALQAGWYFPNDIFTGHKYPNRAKDLTRYADWINESLYQLITVRGYTNIKYLVLFTEPLNYKQKNVNQRFTEPEYYAKVVNQINDVLTRSGIRQSIKLVGPNSGSTDTAAYIDWSVKNLNKVIDIYSWHTYNGKTPSTSPPLEYDGWKEIVDVGQRKIALTKKPFWIDEYAATKPSTKVRTAPDYGNYLAQAVAAFTNAGAQTSLLWLLFDQKYPGDAYNDVDFYNGVQRFGLAKYPKDELESPTEPFPALYAFNLMSKYLGDYTTTKVYKTTSKDSIYVVSTQSKLRLTVMIVNASHTYRRFKVNFKNAVNCTLTQFLYDPANIDVSEDVRQIQSTKKFNNITNTFSDGIPGRGVSIYCSNP